MPMKARRMKTVTHKIRLNDDERQRLAAELQRQIRMDNTVRLLTAVHHAERIAVPANKLRLKPSLAKYSRPFYLWAQKIQQEALQMPALPRTETPAAPPPPPIVPLEVKTPVPEPVVESAQEVEPEVMAHDSFPEEPEVMPPPPESDPVRAIDTYRMVAELLRRFSEGFLTDIRRDIVGRLDRIEAAATAKYLAPPTPARPSMSPFMPPAQPPKPARLRIIILGLMKDQFEHVREKTAHLPFDLVWIDKEQSNTTLPRADYCVVQRHSSHKWWTSAQKQFSNGTLSFVDGGITGTVQSVMDIHSRVKAKALGV